MKHLFLLSFCAILLASSISAVASTKQSANFSELAFINDVQAMMDSDKVVGLSLAVVRDNQIIYNRSFGIKDIASWQPVTNTTLFRIASISKSFVATAIMQLVDQKRIALDDDINKYLDFSVRNPRFPDSPITIEMMLSHTSSINDSEGYYVSYDCINPDKNANYANAYNDYAPGTGYEYCNLNFNLCGIIVEKVSGERFDKYVERHIMRPLDIYGSFCVNSIDRSRCATLYAWQDDSFVAQPGAYTPIDILDSYQMCVNTLRFSPAGGVKISARDLAKYMLMHMNYGKSPLAKSRILSKKSAMAMQADHTPTPEDYGLALEKTDEYVPGVMLHGHTGGAYGLCSAMFFDPDRKFGFVVICNGARRGSQLLKDAQSIMYKHFIEGSN